MITNRGSIMFHHYCGQFLEYCQLTDFSARSIQALPIRLNELTIFLKTRRIRSVKRVRYRHLVDFTADYNDPSIHVIKSRVCVLRQFYYFLSLHRIVPEMPYCSYHGLSSNFFISKH